MKEKIKNYICQIKDKALEYQIFFVVNVNGKTDTIDYNNLEQSILTEYLTEEEYDVMIEALKNNHFNVKVFNNEIHFINYILQNKNTIDYSRIVVFNLARNGKGLNKKALIPAFCQMYNIKHTGSGAYNVCLGRHKFHTNCILQGKNIPVPKTWYFTDNGWLLDDEPPKNEKVIIKPSFESASRGISQESIISYSIENKAQIEKLKSQFEQNIMVQQFIKGYEVQVPIIKFNTEIIPLMAVGIIMDEKHLLQDKIITYDIAYDETYSFYDFSKINCQLAVEIMETAKKACEILNLDHYCRFDFRIDSDNNFYITDISTHPFLIKHSAFAYVFQTLDFKYEDMFALLISLIVN